MIKYRVNLIINGAVALMDYGTKSELKVRHPKLESYTWKDVWEEEMQNLELHIKCPKKYYQLISFSDCQRCKEFVRVKDNKIICKYKKEKTEPRPENKLNDLSGSEWLFFTKSVLRTSFPLELGHDLRKKHGASKPPRLMEFIIRFFTKPGEIVLDPFAGVGGTLIGASLCDRKAIGIEINSKWIEIYKQVCEREGIKKQLMIHGDCLEELSKFIEKGRKFNAIITDPPYSPALEKTLCDGKYGWARRKTDLESFSDDPRDFRNSKNFEEYYNKMEKASKLMYEVLENKRYLVMMIRDSYQEGRYIPASFHVAERTQNVGFVFKGIKIWHNTGAPVRPYGYPFSYVPNIVHHSILIFRKEK
jgi:DNA modification methylase